MPTISRVGPRDSRAIRAFVDLPFRLFGAEANWVPSLVGETLSFLRRRHPFFEHSDAAFFLARAEGKPVGRIAAIDHRNYNGHHGTRTAFFCWFDCVDDPSTARDLLAAAGDWARSRGLDRIIGPKGFLRTAGVGLLVEGFGHFPAVGVPWNPPYLERLVAEAGFTKVTDYLSGYLDAGSRGDERLYRVAEIARKRGRFEILAFRRRRELRTWLPKLKELQHAAFADNPNYVPSTDAEFGLQARNLIFIAELGVLRFLVRDGELAGFSGAYPNIGHGLKKARGRLLPLGWWHILRDRAVSTILDLNGVGILPKFQKLGGDAILFTALEKGMRASRYRTYDFIQVDERNFLSKSGIEHFTIRWAKRHRLYGKSLVPVIDPATGRNGEA